MHVRKFEWRGITAALLHALQSPKGVFAAPGGCVGTSEPARPQRSGGLPVRGFEGFDGPVKPCADGINRSQMIISEREVWIQFQRL